MSAPIRVTPQLVLDALRMRWVVVLMPLIIVPVVAVAASTVIKPKMKASSLVLVQEDSKVDPVMRAFLAEASVNRRIPAIASIVKSNRTLEAVLRKLGEIADDATPQDVATRVGSFRGQIDVYGEGAGLIRISVVGRWTGRVYEGLTLLTEALEEELVRPQTEALAESVGFMDIQLDRLRTELEAVEDKIREVKGTGAGLLPEVHKLDIENYTSVSGQLITAEAEWVEAMQRLETFGEQLTRRGSSGGGGKHAAALAKARATLRTLRATYTPAHPDVRAAQAVVDQLEDRVARSASAAAASPPPTSPKPRINGPKEYQALVRDTQALKEKVDHLDKRAEALLESIRLYAVHEADLSALLRSRDVKRSSSGTRTPRSACPWRGPRRPPRCRWSRRPRRPAWRPPTPRSSCCWLG